MGRVKAWLEEQERVYSPVGEKFVCSNCIDDYAIKEFIELNAESLKCSYCANESEDDNPIAVPIDDFIEFILNGIRSQYGHPGDEGLAWEGGWVGDSFDSWDLLQDELELDFRTDALFEDVSEALNGLEWCKKDPYGDERKDVWYWDWEHFCERVKHHTRYVFFKLPKREDEAKWYKRASNPYYILYQIGEIVNDLELVQDLPIATEFFRVRVHDGIPFTQVSELGPPPVEHAKSPNRMSPAGIPMFYGAVDAKTALAETTGATDKFATVSRFKTMQTMKVLDLTRLTSVPSIFDQENRHKRQAIFFMWDFLSDLSKPVPKDGREHIEYVPTQIVTEYFRHIFKDEAGDGIHGIMYPSSVSLGGKSCVLFCTIENCTQDEADQGDNILLSMSSKNLEERVLT